MKHGFVRPIGSRKIEVLSCSSALPWDVWNLFANEQSQSRLWGNQIVISTNIGGMGKISEESLGCSFTWELETIDSRKPSNLKLAVIGNPWHHRPDIVDSLIEFDIGQTVSLKLSGFDISHSKDAIYLAASNWAWSRMSSILTKLDRDTDVNLSGNRGFNLWVTIPATPDQIRYMLLTAEEAAKWFADIVVIQPRLSGDFLFKWQRAWGEIIIHGNLTVYEPNRVTFVARENPFSKSSPFSVDFSLEQTDLATKVNVKIDGFDVEPWATPFMFAFSEFIQVSLTSLSLIYSSEN